MQKTQSVKFLKNRKFMLVLPLLTLPFVTLAFWALGGGTDAPDNTSVQTSGLNPELPDAKLKGETGQNKMSIYNKAQEDSIRLRQEIQNDPYYKKDVDSLLAVPDFSEDNKLNASPFQRSGDPAEAKIYARLDALNKAITQPSSKSTQGYEGMYANKEKTSPDIDRLESMMEMMQENNSAEDPEMKQLGGMLDKVLDIQHPERVKERMKEKDPQRKSAEISISQTKKAVEVSYLGATTKARQGKTNSFYTDEKKDGIENTENAIAAAVAQMQTLTTGSTVKLRLLSDVLVNGHSISKGTFVYGLATMEGERLLITISGIRFQNNLVPVALSVYDMDGMAGIYVPGSLNREVMKDAADRQLQGIDLLSVDPSLKAQAANAGAQTIKGLLSKKVKLQKVTITENYRVFLKDEAQSSN